MNRNEFVEKVRQIYVSEELERITEVVSKIPEKVLVPLYDITKGHNASPPGKYDNETKIITLNEDDFNPKVLFHEIGHSIYHECPEIAEITNSEYKKNPFIEIETIGEGLSWEQGAAEFCANAYQLCETETISTDEDPERFRSLAEKLREYGVQTV